ncbi:hypothetical protein LTS08_005486 [Lithohypha guttulata]|nr:hypothetical protein LTS08_005486 [Lithohypha guttulata]
MTGSNRSRGTKPRSVTQDSINDWLTKVTLEEKADESTLEDDYFTSQLLATQDEWLLSTSDYMLKRLQTALLHQRQDFQLGEEHRWQPASTEKHSSAKIKQQSVEERKQIAASQRRLSNYRISKPKSKRRSRGNAGKG